MQLHEVAGVSVTIDDVPLGHASASATPLDVSYVPGARIVANVAFTNPHGVDAQAICIEAPSTHFVPGLEAIILEKVSHFSLVAATQPRRFRQETTKMLDGERPALREVTGEVDGRPVSMHHLLGFAGADRRALVCTAICLESADPARTQASEQRVCSTWTRSLQFSGQLAPDPELATYVRAMFHAAEHPVQSAAVATLVAALLVGIILSRRRRYG